MSNPAPALFLPSRSDCFAAGLRALACGLALLAAGSPPLARAQLIATNQGRVFSVLEENDMVVKTDRHYTQGLKLSYLQADGDVPRVAARMIELVPSVAYQPNALKFGYQIGQSMFTPANIRTSAAIPSDRPYGGWLYTGLILQRRGETRGGTPVLENFAIDFGIVGPESLAEEAQTWVHELRGRPLPLGWSHQLRTEPGINLKYERSHLFRSAWTDRFALDLIPRGGFSMGNVDTSLRFGGMFRMGWNLPGNFGLQTVDSLSTPEGGLPPGQISWARRLGVFAFVGTEGRLVAHNIFLDGNLYQSSQRVEKELLIGELRTGFAVQLGRCQIGFTQVFRTPEFRKQPEHDAYGSVFAQIVF